MNQKKNTVKLAADQEAIFVALKKWGITATLPNDPTIKTKQRQQQILKILGYWA